jgi:hypothetical protein
MDISLRTRGRVIRLAGAATTAVVVVGLVGLGTSSGAAGRERAHRDAVLAGSCMDSSIPLSVEEDRLDNRLPRNDDPAVAQRVPFATKMIAGGGFEHFGPRLVRQLCATPDLRGAEQLVEQRGHQLWRLAVGRAQSHGPVAGSLPRSDDRPLYWTRLQATAAIRQWDPSFPLTVAQRDALITSFDKASRGMGDISFRRGPQVKRVLVSGFDPYTLDGGDTGSAEGTVGNNIRHGNPSGAVALALDGTSYRAGNGTREVIETYTLPVNYTEFRAGYLEDTVGPQMQAPPNRRIDASVTVSQAGGSQFDLEQWNGRYHGTFEGNDLSLPCPIVDGTPQLAVDNHGCNSFVPRRWGGPTMFHLRQPPQWTTSSLPMGAMIRARTGQGVPRPPGDTWPDESVAFGVIWHTSFTEFPDCTSPRTVERNTPVPTTYPPDEPPRAPSKGSCSYMGGGGNYLSNESAWRNTRLRDYVGLHIPAGHIHTPGMQHFDEGNRFRVSDDTFDAWRTAIVAQTANLVHVVGARS